MAEVKISFANECDIDLLLLEEIVASPSFLSWLLSSIGLPSGELVSVARSVHTETGESDIELLVRSQSQLTKVLIENKIDATLQPRQAERYRERAVSYIQQGICSNAVTVIAAPSAYIANAEDNLGFDSSITYEAILAWLEAADHLGERRQYKLALIRAAIERSRSHWQLVEDPEVTKFCCLYWDIASRDFPELRMKKPSAKPASSYAIIFAPLSLPKSLQLYHDVRGLVNLQFGGMGARIGELQAKCGERLLPAMWLEQAAKSAAIRASVEPIDIRASFDSSEQKVRAALQKAKDLMSWYVEVFGPTHA